MPPGRPADAQHRRMRVILGTLSAYRSRGVPRRTLMAALGQDPASAVDQRVLSRDLANLRASGWHIDTERVGQEDRYRLRVVDCRLRRAFSQTERAQLLRAARAAGLGQIFDDLDPTSEPGPDAPEDVALGIAQRAIEVRSLLTFTYRGRVRTLHPYDIELTHNGWRLRGREADTGLIKVFALERVEDLDLSRPGLAEPVPAGLPAFTSDPMLRRLHEPLDVVVRHAPEHTREVVSQLGAGGHRVQSCEVPDRVESVVTVTFVDSFLDRLIEMEQRVTLVGPPAVRAALRDRLRAVLDAAPAHIRAMTPSLSESARPLSADGELRVVRGVQAVHSRDSAPRLDRRSTSRPTSPWAIEEPA